MDTRRVGPYEIVREIGGGANGNVFLARHVESGAEVALKLLDGEVDTRTKARLDRELRPQTLLEDAQIAAFFNAGEDGKTVWLAAPFVAGESLEKRLDAGALGVDAALELVARVASVAGRLHEGALSHGCLTPSNIIIDEKGEPHLTDVGLARALGPRSGDPDAACYLSPEQARGEEALIDARSDVWSLGAILHEAISGEAPFDAPDAARVVANVLSSDPPALAEHSQREHDAATIVLRCLEKERERRYANAADLAQDCRRALRGEPLLAVRPGGFERRWRKLARHPAPLAGAAAGLAVVALALVGIVLLDRTEQQALAYRLAKARFEGDRALFEANQREEAQQKKGRVLEARALSAELETAFASALAPDEVRAKAQALVAIDPSSEALMLAARQLARVELDDEAGSLLERASKTQPGYAALLELAELRETRGTDAASVYRALLDRAKERKDDESDAALAARAALEPDPSKAIELLTRALERDRRSARLHVRRALARERAGELDPAVVDLDAAAALEPTLARVPLERARIQVERGAPALALGDAERALVLAPRSARAFLERARVRRALGLLREARADTDRALGIRQELAAAFVERALVRDALKDGEGALADLDRALELKPGDLDARVARSSVRLSHQDEPGALADAESAVQAFPNAPEALAARSAVRARRGEKVAAATDLKRAIELWGGRAPANARDDLAALEK